MPNFRFFLKKIVVFCIFIIHLGFIKYAKFLTRAKMLLMLPLHFVGAEHFPLENVMLCKNAFLHSQNAFCRFLTFWFAEHFFLENVMLNILQSKMWCWTFYFVKCTRCGAKIHFLNPPTKNKGSITCIFYIFFFLYMFILEILSK